MSLIGEAYNSAVEIKSNATKHKVTLNVNER